MQSSNLDYSSLGDRVDAAINAVNDLRRDEQFTKICDAATDLAAVDVAQPSPESLATLKTSVSTYCEL